MFILGLLVGALLSMLISFFVSNREIRNLMEVNRFEVESLKSMYEFDNKKLQDAYTNMMNYVSNNKSRLSKKQRIELNNLWNKVLLNLPLEYEDCIVCTDDLYTYNTLTLTEHKQALLEALDEIRKQNTIDKTTLVKVSYHLYFIMYNVGGKNE